MSAEAKISGYRSAARPREEPRPETHAWDHYQRACRIHSALVLLCCLTGVVLSLESLSYLLSIAVSAAPLVVITLWRVKVCLCPRCGKPITGGYVRNPGLPMLLGVFPRECVYCHAPMLTTSELVRRRREFETGYE